MSNPQPRRIDSGRQMADLDQEPAFKGRGDQPFQRDL